jgi:hypothetical protein
MFSCLLIFLVSWFVFVVCIIIIIVVVVELFNQIIIKNSNNNKVLNFMWHIMSKLDFGGCEWLRVV